MSNLKEIKDAARQAFSDQQSQDTEGGVPDIVSFCAGFLAGYRHLEQVIDRAELIQTNREDVLPAAQEAAHYTWLDDKIREVELREVRANRLVVDLARQLTDLQSAFDDRVIEMQNAYETLDAHDEMLIATVKKMNLENDKLINALQFYAEYKNDNPDNEYNNELALSVLKEIGEE